MEITEAITSRRSIRQFLPDPVDPALIRHVLECASRAPSGGNLQPWHVEVVAGEPLAALKRAMIDRKLGEEQPEYQVYPADLPEPYRTRRFVIGEAMYDSLGIARDDRAGRRAWFARNFQLFGAPLALFVHIPRLMGPPQWSDLGMFMQSIMLLLRAEGLDSCPQECWAMFPDTVRRHVPIPEEHMLFSGMAIGFRDPDAAVNGFPVERTPTGEFIRYHGL